MVSCTYFHLLSFYPVNHWMCHIWPYPKKTHYIIISSIMHTAQNIHTISYHTNKWNLKKSGKLGLCNTIIYVIISVYCKLSVVKKNRNLQWFEFLCFLCIGIGRGTVQERPFQCEQCPAAFARKPYLGWSHSFFGGFFSLFSVLQTKEEQTRGWFDHRSNWE